MLLLLHDLPTPIDSCFTCLWLRQPRGHNGHTEACNQSGNTCSNAGRLAQSMTSCHRCVSEAVQLVQGRLPEETVWQVLWQLAQVRPSV